MLVLALVSGVVLLLPRVRRKVRALVAPQLAKAWENLRDVLRTPKKGLQLFGGNLIAQIFFALTLWAALEMYGESLGADGADRHQLVRLGARRHRPRARAAWA